MLWWNKLVQRLAPGAPAQPLAAPPAAAGASAPPAPVTAADLARAALREAVDTQVAAVRLATHESLVQAEALTRRVRSARRRAVARPAVGPHLSPSGVRPSATPRTPEDGTPGDITERFAALR